MIAAMIGTALNAIHTEISPRKSGVIITQQISDTLLRDGTRT